MAHLRVVLFGRLRIVVGDQDTKLPPTTVAVLIRLLLAEGQPVTVDQLVRDVWQHTGPVRRDARIQVQKRISELRRILDPDHPGDSSEVVRTERGAITTYRLLIPREQVDIFQFQDLVEHAQDAGDPATAVELLRSALTLWQGEPLLASTNYPFAKKKADDLTALHDVASRQLMRAYHAMGSPSEALRIATALLADHPDDGEVAELAGTLRRSMARDDVVDSHRRNTALTPHALPPSPNRPPPSHDTTAYRRALWPDWRWPTVACLALGIAVTFAVATRHRLGNPGVLVGALLAAAVILAIAVRATRQASLRSIGSTSAQIDAASAMLAETVGRQWRAEIALRQLHDPEPLAVRWHPSQLDVADHFDVVTGEVTGQPDQIDKMVEAFRRLQWRRLVVLGPPGSGKTTLAVLLTYALLTSRQPDESVPVLLSLSTWRPAEEPFHAWLRRRLTEDYPALTNPTAYGRTAITDLLADRRILPVLDGLDELPCLHHAAALNGINRAMIEGDSLILTCRTAEYQAAIRTGDVLTAAAVIEPHPIAPGDLLAFLRKSASPARLTQWRPVFDQLTQQPAGPLAAALSNPLMVFLCRTVYTAHDTDPGELTDSVRFPDQPSIEQHLLSALIPAVTAMVAHSVTAAHVPSTIREPRLVHRWLAFLATQANQLGTYDLAWWRFHEAVPLLAHRRNRAVLAGALAGITAALLFGFGNVLLGGHHSIRLALEQGLAYACGTATAVFFTSRAPADPSLTSRSPTWRLLRTALVGGAVSGLVFGLVSGLAALHGGAVAVVTWALDYGLAAGAGIGLAIGLAGLVAASGPVRANLHIRGRERMVLSTTAAGLAIGTLVGLILGAINQAVLELIGNAGTSNQPGPVVGPIPALTLGTCAGLMFGLIKWIRTPIDSNEATSPISALRADRTMFLLLTSMVTATYTLAFALADALQAGHGPLTALSVGMSAGTGGGLMTGLVLGMTARWPFLLMTRIWLALCGHQPWRIMAFLEDAHKLGLVRQVGPIYQFRHARIHDHLAAGLNTGAAVNLPTGPISRKVEERRRRSR